MRYPFESNTRSSWQSHKNRGKELYEQQQYAEALQEYQSALDPILEAPRQEQQIILSNIVACRLKLGGDHNEHAVKEAKQCVALNPAWAKGHVRLASAFIALGGHSNDACNELQTALRLDPGNSLARQMLMRELRRDHAARPDPPVNPDYVPPQQQQQHQQHQQHQQEPVLEVDDSVSLTERIQFLVARASLWYERQSSEAKQLLKIGVVLMALYVAFGGRFGLESLYSTPRHGNYERGNIYDQYRQNYHQQTQYSPPSYSDHRRGSQYSSYSRGTNTNFNNQYSSNTGYASSYSDASSSLASVAMVLGAAYVCHRNGINPLHAMFMMNMMRGGGGRRRGYGMGGGGFRFGRPRW